MLVSFWSGSIGKSGVTTNAACLAAFYAMRFKKKVLLFENHVPRDVGLSDMLVGRRRTNVVAEPFYYNRHDTDYLYSRLRSGMPVRTMYDVTVRLADGRLHYLPKSEQLNQEVFDYELNKVVDRLLDELSTEFDMVFADLTKFNSLTTRRILERSDHVFINLPALDEAMEEFLYSYDDADSSKFANLNKASVLVNACDAGFKSEYADLSERDGVFFMPYVGGLPLACRDGRVIPFIKKNYDANSKDKNFGFINELRRLSSMLYEESETCGNTLQVKTAIA